MPEDLTELQSFIQQKERVALANGAQAALSFFEQVLFPALHNRYYRDLLHKTDVRSILDSRCKLQVLEDIRRELKRLQNT